MLSWEYEPLSTWPGGTTSPSPLTSSHTTTSSTDGILNTIKSTIINDLTSSACLSSPTFASNTNTNNSSPSEQMTHSTSIHEDTREGIGSDSTIQVPRSTSSPVNSSPPFCTSIQPNSPCTGTVSGTVQSSATLHDVSTDHRIPSPTNSNSSNSHSTVSTPLVLPTPNHSYIPSQPCCSSMMYCHPTYPQDSSMPNQYSYGMSAGHDSHHGYNCCGTNQLNNKHSQHSSVPQSHHHHHHHGSYHYPAHHSSSSSTCTTCSSSPALRDKTPIYSNGCESIPHSGNQPYINNMDCEFCTKTSMEMPTSQSYSHHQQHATTPPHPASYMQAPSSFEKFKIANTTGILRPAVPIHKSKRKNSASGSVATNSIKGRGGRASTTSSQTASVTGEGNTSNPGGLERDSKMAKEMTIVLNAIPGMEKVRWQSIIQSTRGPEVGDRETQRRVKEAEVLVGKVFGGDVRKMLTLLMNEHLDFLVKFVGTTLSTSRRGHKKVRDQVFNALKEIKERESELEGDAENEVNEELMS